LRCFCIMPTITQPLHIGSVLTYCHVQRPCVRACTVAFLYLFSFSTVFSASVFRTPRPVLIIIMPSVLASNGPISGSFLRLPSVLRLASCVSTITRPSSEYSDSNIWSLRTRCSSRLSAVQPEKKLVSTEPEGRERSLSCW
jgi:hypothetical protein